MTTPYPTPALPPRATISTEERAMLVAFIENSIQHNDEWPLDLAAINSGLPVDLLFHLVRYKVIPGKAPRGAGIVGTCNIDDARTIAAQLGAARAPVEGLGILAPDAAKKYGFGVQSIYQWHEAGWVKLIDLDKSGHRLFNEGDLAVARVIADKIGQARGRAVFPSKPRPGRPRKPRD